MIDLGKYTDTVLSAYAVTLALLATIIVLTVIRNAKARKKLAEAEARRNA